MAAYAEVGDYRQAILVLGNIGEVLFYRGDLAGAESKDRQVIAFAREIGDSDEEAYTLNNIAVLLESRGDLSSAKSTFERVLSLWGDSNPHESSAAILGLGKVQLAQGDLAGARKSRERALAMRQKLAEKGSIAENGLALAELSLEEGRPADAEATARDAAAEFKSEKIPEMQATGYALLARANFEQGKYEEARQAARRAITLSVKSQAPLVRLFIAVVADRVSAQANAKSGRQGKASSEGLRKLQSALAEAEKFGFFGLQLEARLAIGEIELQSGLTAAGRKSLTDLEKTALAKGYGLIARKAAAAGGSSQSAPGT